MSDLSTSEKSKLGKILDIDGGYVLKTNSGVAAFTDSTFRDFVIEYTGIDLYDSDKVYTTYGTSKAKRLKALWDKGSNIKVGKLLLELLNFWKSENFGNKEIVPISLKDTFDECCQIAQRLINGSNENENDDTLLDSYFEKHQEQIINKINSAKYLIWIAVAWFTDNMIFDSLKEKRSQGINVQLIIDDNEANKKSGLDYEKYFETYRIKHHGKFNRNIMHHKFCVIDLTDVIHGSYNWTKNAAYNHETITKQSRLFLINKRLGNLLIYLYG